MSSACPRRSITACISGIPRCGCTRWAGARSTNGPPRTICGIMAHAVERGGAGRRHGALDLAGLDARHPGRVAGRQPHRRLGGDRPARRRDGGARRRDLPDRPRHLRRRGAARVSRPAAPGGAGERAADHVRHARRRGRGSTRTRGDYQMRCIDETVAARRAHVTARRRPARSTRSSRSNRICRSTRCRAGGRSAHCRSPSRSAASPIRRCAARLVAAEALMKPRDSRVAGRRRRHDRSAEARLRQSLSDARASIGMTRVSPTSRRARNQAPGRGDHRPRPRERRPDVRAADRQRIAG